MSRSPAALLPGFPTVSVLDMRQLRTPQAFYDAVNLLHTTAMENLPLYDFSQVTRILETAMESLVEVPGVRP